MRGSGIEALVSFGTSVERTSEGSFTGQADQFESRRGLPEHRAGDWRQDRSGKQSLSLGVGKGVSVWGASWQREQWRMSLGNRIGVKPRDGYPQENAPEPLAFGTGKALEAGQVGAWGQQPGRKSRAVRRYGRGDVGGWRFKPEVWGLGLEIMGSWTKMKKSRIGS